MFNKKFNFITFMSFFILFNSKNNFCADANGHKNNIAKVVSAAASFGAIVGSAKFFIDQKPPRNRYLGIFVGSCIIQQGVNLYQFKNTTSDYNSRFKQFSNQFFKIKSEE